VAAAAPQLIPQANATPSLVFPSTTSSGLTTTPSTGPTPQIVPTVGSTAPSASPNTPLPGATVAPPGGPPPPTTPSSRAPSVSSIIPGATSVPISGNTTIAPVNQSELVSGQLNDILKSGSPYTQLARSQALQAASARGLQNSSIAAGAGEAAAISAALPIAQGNATNELTVEQANQQALNTSAQIQQQATATQQTQKQQIEEQTQSTLVTQAAALTQQLTNTLTAQAQQGTINFTLQAQTEAANINQILTQGNVNSMLSAQQSTQQIQQINQTSLDTINQIDSQAKANASQDGPALQAQYLTGVTNIMNATAAQIQAIYQTTGLSSTQQQAAVLTANQQMQENINNLAAYYASSPLWDTGQQPTPIPASAIPKPVAPVATLPRPTPTPTRTSTPAPTAPTATTPTRRYSGYPTTTGFGMPA